MYSTCFHHKNVSPSCKYSSLALKRAHLLWILPNHHLEVRTSSEAHLHSYIPLLNKTFLISIYFLCFLGITVRLPTTEIIFQLRLMFFWGPMALLMRLPNSIKRIYRCIFKTHNTIYTFKNYFITVFLTKNFQFSTFKNYFITVFLTKKFSIFNE